ncbi:MAG: MarR family transcriptional regulator [Candidatus Aureabacteria bacterium]|nr:MarR family transcriptional regulator [Candidatus Auribacterota bacterium]
MSKDISAFSEEAMRNIIDIHRSLMKTRMSFKGMDNITIPQMASLALIEASTSLRMKDIAKGLSITLPAATGMIERLYKTGLVKRVADEKDRRVINILLTEKGKDIFKKIQFIKKKTFELIFSRLSEKDRSDYIRILKKARDIVVNEKTLIIEDLP